MDLTNIFLFCLISLVIGAVLMILIQYYAFIRYFNVPDNETADQRTKSINEKYQLPDTILASIHAPEIGNRNPTIAFNLIFQFLFFELRNANKVRKWFHRKLSLELDELISKTTTGKLFDKLSIRDLDLGAQFPEIKNMKVLNADLHDTEGHIENLEVVLDIHYQGNFRMSIDADMVLGKKGFLSVKVKHISGLARLQFTRKPYTHWSLCFLGDPVIDFDIETQFQGRQMQSNVTSLISNQIRKAIRRKHTLPNYKLRYKPFFHKSLEEEFDLSDINLDGQLDISIAELTRLSFPCHINHVFCTITLAPMPWVAARQNDDNTIVVVLDIEIHKAKNQQIGIVFKQSDQMVMVDTVIPNTPAMKAKLCKNDVLISIEGRKITNINHIAKIVKSLNRPVFTLRIERIVQGVIDNDTLLAPGDADEQAAEEINDMNISFSKTSDTVQIGARTRQNSLDKVSSDSSRSNTPTHSPCKAKESIFNRSRGRSISRANSEAKSTASGDDNVSIKSVGSNGKPRKDSCDNMLHGSDENRLQQHTTVECLVNSFITMNDSSQYKLESNSIYLNLNVFGRCNDETILLGYLNIPVHTILAECNDSTLGHFIKQYTLSPPDTPNLSNHVLSMQSGFDPKLCFGDVLLVFSWSGSTSIANESTKKAKSKLSSSTDKLDDDRPDANISKQHDFQRKHFQRSTQCDFCGRKIWLKDGVQCRDCSMNCHKKCITKCQNSTICGPVDATAAMQQSGVMPPVEFKVTEVDCDGEIDDFEEIDEPRPRLEQHRQSFSDLISQGIKRVNSANNLAIPAIVSSLNQGTRSLPPSPQHTPRKQSLVNQSTNPFVVVTQKLDQLPTDINDITREQIVCLTEALIGWGTPDEMMQLAKTSSRTLFADLEPTERVEMINNLLSKLRIALDSETTAHANLAATLADPSKSSPSQSTTSMANFSNNNNNHHNNAELMRTSSETALQSKTAGANNDILTPKKLKENPHDLARKAFLLGQSEERVQALSVIMLHLCTGLQYAQGIANQ